MSPFPLPSLLAGSSSLTVHPGKIYNTACGVYDTYLQPSSISLCASSRFYCQTGTTNIEQYDDPVTGWAYNCTADAVKETCSGDTIVRCVSPPDPKLTYLPSCPPAHLCIHNPSISSHRMLRSTQLTGID